MKLITVIFGLFLVNVIHAQDQNATDFIRNGNNFYKQQQWEQAVAEYDKALAKEPGNTTAKFNRANALYRAGKQVDATKNLSELSAAGADLGLRQKSYYNRGVILSAQKNLEESIEAYKNALRLDPNDKDARENLQKALLELKKKNPPQPKDQDNKKDQDQQKNQQQSKMNQKEAEQRLKLLQQKEKEVQERLQKEKAKSGGGGQKDW